MTKKNKIIIAIVSIILIIGVAVTIFMNLDNKTTVDLYTVSEQAPISFSGSANPVNSQDIYYDATKGNIIQYYVQDGDTVAVGQDLILYENQEMKEGVEDLTRAYNSALNSYNSASGQLGKAKNDLTNANNRIGNLEYKINNYNPNTTQKTLNNSSQVPSEQNNLNTTDPTANYPTNTEDIMTLKAELESLKAEKQGYESAITGLEDGVMQAKSALDDNAARLQRAKEKMNITEKAKVDGKISLNKEAADAPATMTGAEPVISIKSGDIIIKSQVSEYDYDKIKVDDKVKLTILNSNKIIDGKISKIDDEPVGNEGGQIPGATQQKTSNVANYSFEVVPSEAIQHGFSVNIKLAKNDIYIPSEAIEKLKGKYYVYTVNDGITAKKKIEITKEDSLYKLVSGLKIGEQIISNISDITEGMEVEVNNLESNNNKNNEVNNTKSTDATSTTDENTVKETDTTTEKIETTGKENDSN